MIFTTNLKLPPPTIYWQFPSAISPFYKLVWPFLWHWKVSGLKKDLLKRGHTNPTPKCTFHMWAQIVAWEVDGPSLQPSTWHLYTLLMPPSWMQRGRMWAGISSSEAGGTAREADSTAWSAGAETSGPVDSWGSRWETVVVGAWWTFLGGGEDMSREECDIAPLRSP